MADESLEQTPDDSIASDLAAAVAGYESRAEAATSAADKTSPESKPKDAADAAPSQTEGQAAETEAGKSEADKSASAETQAVEQSDDDKKIEAEITGKWSPADKEILKKLSPEGRNLIIRRHKEMEAAFTKKTQDFASFRREYEPVDKLFDPYRDRMKAGGWTPQKLIEAWSNVEKRLMEGDGVNVVAGLINGYKLDMGQIARALGLQPRAQTNGHANGEQPPAAQQTEAVSLSPEHPLMRQLSAIQARLDKEDRARSDAARRAQTGAEQRVMNEIEEFKSALDDKGNLLYPHFEEVEDSMALLAQSAAQARKPIPALKELYETAVWANPKLREETLAARDRAQQEKAASEARAKAAQARKAGSSVTGAPGPGGQATNSTRRPERSLREELEAAHAERSAGRI